MNGGQNPQAAIPHGAMVQVTLAHLSDGLLVPEINDAMARVARVLEDRRQRTGGHPGRATITVQVEIEPDKDVPSSMVIGATVKTSLPPERSKSLVRAVGGLMLCQPHGADGHSPDQMALFDHRGKPMGTWLEDRGLIEPGQDPDSPVIGQVGAGG